MRFLLLLFVIVPLMEIVLLIGIGSEIGALATIAWLIVAAVSGIILIRFQGLATALRAREMLAQGKMPGEALIHGFLSVCAGVLFILPGFISDAIGLLLLIPVLRQALIRRWLRRAKVTESFSGNIYDAQASPDYAPGSRDTDRQALGRTLEGEFKRED